MRILAIACVTVALGGVARGESLGVVPRVAEPTAKPAAAKPSPAPRFRIGRPTWNAKVEAVDASFVVRSDDLQVTLSLAIVGRDSTIRDVTLPIQIPPGARAHGLSIVNVAQGESMPRVQAREDYRYTVEHYREDPALLELASSTSAGNQLRLRVYPISNVTPMTVEITIELPKASTAWIDLDGHVIDRLDLRVANHVQSLLHDERRQVSGARSIALDTIVHEELRARPGDTACPLCPIATIVPRKPMVRAARHVDAKTSLLAGNLRPAATLVEEALDSEPVPTVTIGTPQPACDCGPDKRMIKEAIERHYVQLRRCYMTQAQMNPSLTGEVVLKFAIETDGKVTPRPLEGTLADATVRACLASEVSTWSFPRTETTIEVNYPLTFKLRTAR